MPRQTIFIRHCSLPFCALEAHVNSIGEEFSMAAAFSAHEKGPLLEKDVRLEHGEFQLQAGLRMAKLEESHRAPACQMFGQTSGSLIALVGAAFSCCRFEEQSDARQGGNAISRSAVRGALQAIVDALDAPYQAIYKRKFPPVTQGLQSNLTF